MLIRLPFLFLVTLVCATALRADFIPYSSAEVARNIAIFHVANDGVRVELEVLPADGAMFADIIPQDLLPNVLPGLADNTEPGLSGSGGISILRPDGSALPVSFIKAERRERTDRASPAAGQTDPITGRMIPAPPKDPEVVYLELFYSFGDDRPQSIVIRPPYIDETPAAVIGFLTYDRSVPVSQFSYLSKDARLNLDWTDPWYSVFTNRNLNRIARDGTTAFLYAEPREVRHEILIRGRELGPWIGQTIETGTLLDAERQSQILAAALDEFKQRNPVSIEGVRVEPSSVRGAFLTIGERGFQVVEGTPELEADSVFVGVILSYPSSVLPAKASIAWDMFDDTIQKVPVTMIDDAGPFLDWATPDDPEVEWTNFLKRYVDPEVLPVPAKGVVFVPVWTVVAVIVSICALGAVFMVSSRLLRVGLSGLALICLVLGFALSGARSVPVLAPFSGRTDTQVAEAAFVGIMANVYIAALEVTPAARSKSLGPIVSDTAIVDVSAELETGLAIRVPGGGLARVASIRDVVLEDGGMSGNGTFEGIAQWVVEARAGHWGHDHRRRVQYRARVELNPVDGHWSLAALTVLEARVPDA